MEYSELFNNNAELYLQLRKEKIIKQEEQALSQQANLKNGKTIDDNTI